MQDGDAPMRKVTIFPRLLECGMTGVRWYDFYYKDEVSHEKICPQCLRKNCRMKISNHLVVKGQR